MNKGLKDKIIALYKDGKSYNDISKELGCTKSVISYHVSFLAEEKVHKVNREKRDSRVKLEQEIIKADISLEDYIKTYKDLLPTRDFLRIKSLKFEKLYVTKELTIAEYHQNRRRKIKEELIEIKGGKCVVCGYNKCSRSLQFHHLDSKEKEFNISKNLKSIKRENLLKELDKCVLVCANCHGEIHDNIIRLDTKVT